jgi:hypothetical protein
MLPLFQLLISIHVIMQLACWTSAAISRKMVYAKEAADYFVARGSCFDGMQNVFSHDQY